MDAGHAITVFVVLCLGLVFYFFPAAVASSRRHRNAGAIFVMNLLLGWSGLFWIIALIWSCTADVEKD